MKNIIFHIVILGAFTDAENQFDRMLNLNPKSERLKIELSDPEMEQLHSKVMEHPSGLTKKKLQVIYLKALGLPDQEIESRATQRRPCEALFERS